ncbi:MAG: hypothetical protein Sylvanvirus18_10 [Sylvanvirus sp.]|uniref:Uncharacterized protein n=1 Tax=Sylvanvirus sp. TaxID=2487774 RepID=A0A3G5AII4_9VIRU|nr:MAG: hypothetical protein Sylvanvirus18_10 [Sylvanvirus sp.]
MEVGDSPVLSPYRSKLTQQLSQDLRSPTTLYGTYGLNPSSLTPTHFSNPSAISTNPFLPTYGYDAIAMHQQQQESFWNKYKWILKPILVLLILGGILYLTYWWLYLYPISKASSVEKSKTVVPNIEPVLPSSSLSIMDTKSMPSDMELKYESGKSPLSPIPEEATVLTPPPFIHGVPINQINQVNQSMPSSIQLPHMPIPSNEFEALATDEKLMVLRGFMKKLYETVDQQDARVKQLESRSSRLRQELARIRPSSTHVHRRHQNDE